jgi:RNA polymerase sigma-70 factor (ECF subfamily)
LNVETVTTLTPDAVQPQVVMTLVGKADAQQADLVRRAVGGEVEAFEELYRANVGRVYALCLRMTGNPGVAEELTQETFVRAWRKLGSFRGASAFSTWLHRVTVNIVLGHRRSGARRTARIAPSGEIPLNDPAAPPAAPAEAVDLERAIAALPHQARKVFVLHDVEGYRHREIAKLVGIAIGTSKAQLHRARKILRKALSS